jgi:hypothetical protein
MLIAALALSAVLLGPEATYETYTPVVQADRCSAAAISDLGGSMFLAWPVSLGAGRFAVITTVLSYEIGLLDTTLVRLGGRIVDVDPPARRRVAR